MNPGHYLRIDEDAGITHVEKPEPKATGMPYARGHAPVVDVVRKDGHLVLQSPYNHAVLHVLHTSDEVLAWLRERTHMTEADEACLRRICDR